MNFPVVLACLVVGISDGDTLKARCGSEGSYHQIRVRLSGIDAPELKQPYGLQARKMLSDLLYMKEVKLDCPKQDHYWRYICNISLMKHEKDKPQNLDIGKTMIRHGLAWYYRTYSSDLSLKDRKNYAVAEASAKNSRSGLWKDQSPVPPWMWRKERRKR